MRELRRQSETLNTKMDSLQNHLRREMSDLRSEMAHMRGWIMGGVAVMAIFTALNAVV